MSDKTHRRGFVSSVVRGAMTAAVAAGWALPGCASEMTKPLTLDKLAEEGKRPNIVLIMADDMGYSDIGCYGGEIHTPNIDSLAAKGIRFSQFYNCGVCCPTRASLMTGQYPHQTGLGFMVHDPQLPSQLAGQGYPAYLGHLNDHCITIAEGLRIAGYRTMMSGKWHVGETRPHWPVDRGFDRYFGLISGAANFFDPVSGTKAPYFPEDGRRRIGLDGKLFKPDPDGFYMTDAITDYANDFLDKSNPQEQPFFLYVAYTAPHTPLQALPADIEKYRGEYMKGWDQVRQDRHKRQVQMGLIDRKWKLTPRERHTWPWEQEKDKEWMDLKMAIYAAQIDRMDRGIGRILAKIKRMGAAENTLVLFLSDNGGASWGGPNGVDFGREQMPVGNVNSYMSYGVSWANASNTPFRLYKSWIHEGGVATPLIAHWPDVITNHNTITHQPGHVMDIMATCLDVAAVEYPSRYKGRDITPLEGRSLMPILEGRRRQPHEYLCWELMGNRAIRKGKWKLVQKAQHIEQKSDAGKWDDWTTYNKHQDWELYDMQADRTELNNLADVYPEKVKELENIYENWARRCGVQPWPIKKIHEE
jgi:arylsulfatase